MALALNDNSYIDVAGAELYFADRLNTTAWDGATAGDKSASLIQATKAIEAMKFLGTRYDSTQKLSFPRDGIYVDGILMDATVVPENVKEAVCEYAILMLQEDYTAPDDLEAFSEVAVGSIKIKTNRSKGGKSIPPMVSSLLSNYKDSTVRLVKA